MDRTIELCKIKQKTFKSFERYSVGHAQSVFTINSFLLNFDLGNWISAWYLATTYSWQILFDKTVLMWIDQLKLNITMVYRKCMKLNILKCSIAAGGSRHSLSELKFAPAKFSLVMEQLKLSHISYNCSNLCILNSNPSSGTSQLQQPSVVCASVPCQC